MIKKKPVQICFCFSDTGDAVDEKYQPAEKRIHLPHGNKKTFDFLSQTVTGIYLEKKMFFSQMVLYSNMIWPQYIYNCIITK